MSRFHPSAPIGACDAATVEPERWPEPLDGIAARARAWGGVIVPDDPRRTAVTHLKAIDAKFGIHRQSELSVRVTRLGSA